jgi:hypothetical protein
VCKLSRWARADISAFYSLYESKRNGDDDTSTLTLPLIECVAKEFKTHWAVIQFDAGFINRFVSMLESATIVNN